MALYGLLRVASHQLRLLSLRAMPGMTQLADQPRCWCHDDSKRAKRKSSRPKNISNRKSSKAVGPAVSLLEKDLQDILREQERQEKLQERSSLQRRLDLLLSLGCTMDQIQSKVKVLDLSEEIILQRATMLKETGRSPVTVNLLLDPYFSSLYMLHKRVQRKEDLDSATCAVLQCSLEELDLLRTEHPSLNRFRCVTAEEIMEKARVLHSYGITSEEIKAFPAVLNIKIENLQYKLDTLKTLRDEGSIQFDKYPLKTVIMRTRSFDKCIKNTLLGRVKVDGSLISIAMIAERLGVTVKDIEDVNINLGLSTALMKIDYLLGEGISGLDIVNHIHIMKYSLKKIQRAVDKSKSVVVSPASLIYIVLSFLSLGHLPRRNSFKWYRQKTFVASLCRVQSKDLPTHSFLRPLWSTDRICIKRNFDFLVAEGFSEQDIFSCLVLLAHDPDHLQAYYLTLWERPELAPHAGSEAWTDKKQTLSLLQYVIEKDMNFRSPVYNVEIEAEPALLEKEGVEENRTLKKEPPSSEAASFDPETV